ncbi:hypothetical protein HY640_01810 [Candidatus Woesearchaeota archaeon]|nr:hypothetical protein [Candidatus Woesearchaeota archaeon]
MTRLTTEQAKKMLSDCSPDKSFWVNNGPVMRNLNELSNVLKGLNEDQFCHHVNKEKSDFSKWVGEVIGDETLAKTLQKAKTKSAAITKINQRLETLRKAAAK